MTELQISEYAGDIGNIMPLLLIGDESEKMISRYISSCRIYVGSVADDIVSVCAVDDNGDLEIKNLAVREDMRKKGIGRAMLRHVERLYPDRPVMLGTGETPSTLHFYRSCGYEVSHIVPDFFINNYPEPIIEEGMRLRDMVYLIKHPDNI